ncbi:Gpi16 subunit, GPI transamidase component [Suhomyces tanzawaensis NRRL Y-17324]|uniref:Gpi16 subunit, GPI transamidase component n=1 Tax=Suhomyces tanzawaensis NRRL Y-17324 TaxID=984487 RepID=A0A1E4SM94_9ASCO|nr:Gpi16 subunit, GPI transamidase component [Suhomyces tanzawaensis NRRL Y-17324]ODV80630.1 Gpi16 subunit, GPI transamidase component [Suhomyces tanzawaensis NRRL Y-17324]
MISWLKLLFLVAVVAASERYYNETLSLKPLPNNNLLASFQFHIESQPIDLEYYDDHNKTGTAKHYSYFPRSLGPILEATNTRELHLRFTQGWWDSGSWGLLPQQGLQSGGTGVEMWAVVEAPDSHTAKQNWFKLSKTLSGFFCASLNFIDDSITAFPRYAASHPKGVVLNPSNHVYLIRASLPSEPICTENLTPFLKLLPTRGKAGISSLLDGHKVFDSLWHGMSIDITTECVSAQCHYQMEQSVNAIVDITRSIRKKQEGGLPKPTPGDKLRCDDSKTFNIWQCFPLDEPTNVTWSLDTIYGRKLKGPAFIDDPESTAIKIDIDSNHWDVDMKLDKDDALLSWRVSGYEKDQITEYIKEEGDHDIEFITDDSTFTAPVEQPPLYASRSLTGYSLDKGGFRTVLTNPSESESVEFIYFETLPWFMRLYLNTLTMKVQNSTGTYEVEDESVYVKNRYFQPAIDRKRPSHLEFVMTIPPQLTLFFTYQFDKSLLLYHEYPPDANHGFAVEPAIITVLDKSNHGVYEVRTTSVLLTLPTPDFSMPYNVIILTCTVMSLAFGCIFNLLTKKVITENELEKLSEQSKLAKIVSGLRAKVQRLKSLVRR